METGSFEKASGLASEWGCRISDDAVRSCVMALGKRASENPLVSPCEDSAGPEDVLVIMMDGWMARHRGKDWGKKKQAPDQERVHWHEIKSGIIYRLKDHASLSPGRGALLAKHVVATPADTDPATFGRRVQNEAYRMGLGVAAKVYIVMDGGLWLWHIFDDRFKHCAVGTLDFYHASEHLYALAADLYPDDNKQAKAWCKRILNSLKRYSAKRLFSTLQELLAEPPRSDPSTIAAIESANSYFQRHRDHMNYARAKRSGLPIGSGSMESQCSQFQNRLKRRGQFWSKEGFAGLLEVSVRHQNAELRSLWAA